MKKQQRGFTLIELMIAVVVVSILSAIALPAYNSYVLRGKMNEAYTNLADLRVKLEQFYQDNRNYGSTVAVCGVAMPVTPAVSYFGYTCNWDTGGTNQTFTVTATGVASTSTASFIFTINQNNTKTSTTPWGNNTGCWITKPGGAC